MNIRMKDLFYIYESNDEQVVALRGLDLNVELGECLVIRGPNGSGKSTLVKLLTGYQKPTAGEIYIDRRNISEIDPIQLRRQYVASVNQNGSLIKELTVSENLTLAYSLNSSVASQSQEITTQILEEHNFSHLATRYPDQLSAGERQYVSLLSAVATDPQVLVADEPTEELDHAGAKVIYSLLKSLCSKTIVILVTHDIRAEEYATRTVRIREGRISEEWSAGEAERSVIDEFGWMRVREIMRDVPTRVKKELSESMLPILEVSGLKLQYGGKEIFTDVNFSGRPGQLLALDSTLPAKTGKSSLLRILSGLQEVDAGSVVIKGQVIGGLNREVRAQLRNDLVSYLPQRGNALERITLGEYLGSAAVDLGKSLNNRRSSPLGNFSGGERARIELLKIIAESRPILLLDEPISQMDERRTNEAIEALFGYLENGGLVIMSTRNEALLAAADHIILLG